MVKRNREVFIPFWAIAAGIFVLILFGAWMGWW